MKLATITILSATLFACGQGDDANQKHIGDRALTFTLYRNSTLSPTMRVHWATFDADDLRGYNKSNCEMAARILNANLARSAKSIGDELSAGIGFWCEAGVFDEDGPVPNKFFAEFPTDVK